MLVRKFLNRIRAAGRSSVDQLVGYYNATAGHRVPLIGMLIAMVGFGALAVFVSFFGGFAIGKYKEGGYWTANHWEKQFFGNSFRDVLVDDKTAGLPSGASAISSTFIDFIFTSIPVPTEGQGNGGGLTEVGNQVLLVTQNGSIFVFKEDRTVERSKIIAPDNGLEAYRNAAEGRLRHLRHNVNHFRYNDIEFLPIGEAGALALSYTAWDDANTCYQTVISLLRLRAGFDDIATYSASRDDWERIYQTEPCLKPKDKMRAIEGITAGGRLAFKAPSTLALGSGDYHMDGVYADDVLAQRIDNAYGKVIEIDLADNSSRIVSTGHRNMQGVAYDSAGNLWVAEHAMRGGDELNFIREGVDYGWPSETLGTRYSGLPWPGEHSDGHHDTFEPPAFAWLPSIAISSLRLIENIDPSWDGDLLLASLAATNLYRIRLNGENVRFVEEIEVGQPIRYALPRQNGEILLWTDSRNLITLTQRKGNATQEFIDGFVEARVDVSFQSKVRDQITACLQCHVLFGSSGGNAPPLGTVAGNSIGGTAWAGYSEAMRGAAGKWDHATLDAFLANPQTVVPGTMMPSTGLEDEETRDAVVELLFALREDHN